MALKGTDRPVFSTELGKKATELGWLVDGLMVCWFVGLLV